jgi:hypothetical protein
MKADALWSPEVVVAGVTHADASYSLRLPKNLEPRRLRLGKPSDYKGKGPQTSAIT